MQSSFIARKGYMLETCPPTRILVNKINGTKADPASTSFVLLLALWFILNVVQSVFTPIGSDEAYYWMYAHHLDWGYFDHPPMVALFIKVSGLLFTGELGVRFISITGQLITFILIWKIIDDHEPTQKKVVLFFGIAASIVMFQVYGFITTPDAPLLFFTALFLFSYKRFLTSSSWSNTLLLSISMAGLVYSKYHGGLVIILTILANLNLLRNFRFLIAGISGLVLLTPHIVWQFTHHFPTVGYQMGARMDPFSLKHFLDYWPNQMASFNPFILGIGLFLIIKHKPKEVFQRTLSFIILGFLSFFWIMSLWGHAEPQWTIASSIPMIVLIYHYCNKHLKARKYMYFIVFPTLLLLLIGRISLIFDILPYQLEFHKQKSMVKNIEHYTKDLPVAFINSYQKASVFSFYTGKPAFSINNIQHRLNQFDLWDYDIQFQGKKVAVVADTTKFSSHGRPGQLIDNTIVIVEDSLLSFGKIQVHFSLPPDLKFKSNQSITFPVEIYNPYPYPIHFNVLDNPIHLKAVIHTWGVKTISDVTTKPELSIIPPGSTVHTNISFIIPETPAEECQFGISLTSGIFPEAFNSQFQKIIVTK